MGFRPGIGYAVGALKRQGFVIAILTVIIGVAFKAAMGDPVAASREAIVVICWRLSGRSR
jgi:hypothetical protein